MRRTLDVLVVSVALVSLSALQLAAQTPAIVSDFNTRQLWDIDVSSGAVSNPRGVGIPSYFAGLEFDDSGNLYGVAGSDDSGTFFSIDPLTGSAQLIGSLGLTSYYEGGLAWDSAGGTMYGAQETGSRELFTINLGTGAATIVGNVSDTGDLSAISFDVLGNLFAVDTHADTLLRLNKATAQVLETIPLAVDLGGGAGMDFDPATGTMYVIDGPFSGPETLYALDTSTGDMTLVGSTSQPGRLSGITFVPEPTTFTLLALGSLALVMVWRRR